MQNDGQVCQAKERQIERVIAPSAQLPEVLGIRHIGDIAYGRNLLGLQSLAHNRLQVEPRVGVVNDKDRARKGEQVSVTVEAAAGQQWCEVR